MTSTSVSTTTPTSSLAAIILRNEPATTNPNDNTGYIEGILTMLILIIMIVIGIGLGLLWYRYRIAMQPLEAQEGVHTEGLPWWRRQKILWWGPTQADRGRSMELRDRRIA